MSAFAAASFSSARYHSARPTYPASLYKTIHEYHKAHSDSNELAVDIACGTGEATFPELQYFDKVIGMDTSAVMVESARKAYPNIDFVVSSAETFVDSAKLSKESVDLVTVAEGIHWFDLPVFMAEAHRALKPNGTLAFWGYCDAVVTGYPNETKAILELCYGKDKLGPYWQQPGRNLLRDRIPYELPADLFKDVERYENVVCTESKPAAKGNSDTFAMTKMTTVKALQEYVKTWSAWHNWEVAHPGAEDIVKQCFDNLKAGNKWKDDTQVELKWDSFLVMATKK